MSFDKHSRVRLHFEQFRFFGESVEVVHSIGGRLANCCRQAFSLLLPVFVGFFLAFGDDESGGEHEGTKILCGEQSLAEQIEPILVYLDYWFRVLEFVKFGGF